MSTQQIIDRITTLEREYKDLYCPQCEVGLRNLFHFSRPKKRLASLWIANAQSIPDHEDELVNARISLLRRSVALWQDAEASRRLLWGGIYFLFGCAAISTYIALANPFGAHQWTYIAPPKD